VAFAVATPEAAPVAPDRALFDLLARTMAPPVDSHGDITVVLVDDESLRRLGARWPLPRGTWADFLTRVSAHQPAAIGLDAWFETPAPTQAADLALEVADEVRMLGLDMMPGGGLLAARMEDQALTLDGDRRLSTALANSGVIVLGTACEDGVADVAQDLGVGSLRPVKRPEGSVPAATQCQHVASSIASLSLAARDQGSLHVRPDADGVVRRYPWWYGTPGGEFPSLALATARVGRPDHVAALMDHPLGQGDGTVVMRPVAPSSWRVVRFSDVLEAPLETPALAEAFQDRIVLVGVSAIGTEDTIHLPRAVSAPGVFVHASALRDLLDVRPMDAGGSQARAGAVAAAGLFLLLGLLSREQRAPRFLLASVGAALLWVGAVAAAFQAAVLLPVTGPLAAIGGWLSVRLVFFWRRSEDARRRADGIRQAFQQYVAPEVVEELVRDPSRLRLGGKRIMVTAFFSDLQGFTSLSEHMDPIDLVALLNRHLGALADIIVEEGGIVDKFVGDAIVAIFGAPVAHPDHADRAVRAALRCQARMVELADEERAAGRVGLRMRIGVNTGEAVVGNLGSARRFDYTMLGDMVNLAARLEGANNVYGGDILVGPETRKQCEAVLFREVDAIQVKGRTQAVSVSEPVALNARASQEDRDKVQQSGAALHHWRGRRWDEALALYGPLAEAGDPIARAFIARAESLGGRPPTGWDPVRRLSEK
jgi:adenylate cyclase